MLKLFLFCAAIFSYLFRSTVNQSLVKPFCLTITSNFEPYAICRYQKSWAYMYVHRSIQYSSISCVGGPIRIKAYATRMPLLSVCLPVCATQAYVSTYTPIRLYICLIVCMQICMCRLHVHMSVCLYLGLSELVNTQVFLKNFQIFRFLKCFQVFLVS